MTNNETMPQSPVLVEMKKIFAAKKYGNSEEIVCFVPHRPLAADAPPPKKGDVAIMRYPVLRSGEDLSIRNVQMTVFDVVEGNQACVPPVTDDPDDKRLIVQLVTHLDERDLIESYSQCGWELFPQSITETDRQNAVAIIEERWNSEFSDLLD